jgi:hypothetical protein
MQTFLPYEDFRKTAECLDPKRLNKQILEAYQILRAITDKSYGWQHHPAVNMWRKHPWALWEYMYELNLIRRASAGEIHKALRLATATISYYNICPTISRPKWLGYEPFHSSHRSNLLRKDPEWYGKFGWNESPDLPYFWPTHNGF